MNILVFIATLDCGGAERVVTTLTSEWAKVGHDVEICRFSDRQVKPFYELYPQVTLTSLNLIAESQHIVEAISNNIRRLRSVRSILKNRNPDVVVSFMLDTSIAVLIANLGRKTPVIVAEHSDLEHYPVGPIWARLRSLCYKRASRLVVLNRNIEKWSQSAITHRTMVIPNPVPHPTPPICNTKKADQFTILSVGRLDQLKSMNLVIDAFAKLAKNFDTVQLVICGDGPERKNLERLVEGYSLSGRVELKGVVNNIAEEMYHADLFVTSSRTEAFPMALCEAMSAGLFVVSSRFNDSVEDFIRHGQNGLLFDIGDQDRLIEFLCLAVMDKNLRDKGGEVGKAIVSRYEPRKIADDWITLFRSLMVENSLSH